MAADGSPDVTELLLAWRDGNQDALEALVPLVHRTLPKAWLARELANGEAIGGR